MSLGVDTTPANPWAPGGSSVQAGPSVRELFASFRGLVALARAVSEDARSTRARLRTLEQLGVRDDGGPAGVPPLAKVEADYHAHWRALGELEELVRGIDSHEYVLRPSETKRFDLDLLPKGSAGAGAMGELGILPILAGLVVLGRVAIVLGGMYLADRGLKAWETHRLAKLVEEGKDISKLVTAMNPPASTASGIASVTTPIAIAAGVVAVALVAREWKRR